MKRLALVLLLSMITTTFLSSQNLITNPDFEIYKRCPDQINEILKRNYQIIPRWYTASEATPDYFNACSESKFTGVPENVTGRCKPRSGDGYIGLILKADPFYYEGNKNYSEHIQNRIQKPLLKDNLYCFEIWIRIADRSKIATRDFGVWITNTKMQFDNPPDSLPTPNIAYVDKQRLNQKYWYPLRGIYKASGGERFITIGNYQPWKEDSVILYSARRPPSNRTEKFAYYLFDDASLIQITSPHDCDCNMITIPPIEPEITPQQKDTVKDNDFENVEVGQTIILNNIYFAFDKSDLLPESFPELNKLVDLMNRYPSMKIKISGHTDNVGSIQYNLTLSEERSKAVVTYLINQGIEETRLQYQGYGKSIPIADNSTDEGRQKNRRVEFTVLTK